jgi:hypothetical protein
MLFLRFSRYLKKIKENPFLPRNLCPKESKKGSKNTLTQNGCSGIFLAQMSELRAHRARVLAGGPYDEGPQEQRFE